MSQKELEELQRALREITLENNTKEKAIRYLFILFRRQMITDELEKKGKINS